MRTGLVYLFIFLGFGLRADSKELNALAQWGQWRGPLGTGEAPLAKPPLEWAEDKNIRWKLSLPGLGHSSPVVWGDRLFVTAAVPFGKAVEPVFDNAPGSHDNLPVSRKHRFVILAVDREKGQVLWQKTLTEAFPHEGGHKSGSLASNSPVTDGKRVYAFFGSRGLYCLDFEGTLQWSKDLGKKQTKHAHGEGSSPALHGDTLIVNWDHEGQSAVFAFDTTSGEEKWKVARDELTSWSSPIIVRHGKSTQVIVSATKRIRSYALETGALLWECGGLSRNVVATPVAADGMLYAGSSYEKRAFLAINLDGAKGDITGTEQIAWASNQRTPYVPSPVLYKDTLYYLTHYQGILSCIEARTGETRTGPFRLGSIRNVYASLVAADDRIMITDLDGTTLVLDHEDPKPLAINRLEDSFSATPALVGDALYLRGARYLYCIGK
ncbi:MAG: PQQ-binding-like beta-propeller repeat protein [Verrucomicrobiota bacterium]